QAITQGVSSMNERLNCVGWLPLYHDMGLIGLVLTLLWADGDLALMTPEDFVLQPVRWLSVLSELKANITVAPNFAYGLAAKKVTSEQTLGLDLSAWKVALCGAERVHRGTLDLFARKFQEVGFRAEALTAVYGLAEATLAVAFSEPTRLPLYTRFDRDGLERDGIAKRAQMGEGSSIELASVGRALPGVQIEIRNERNEVLEQEHVGRIWVSGPSVMQGYLGELDATEQVLQAGWLDTGDRGVLFEDELYICGRAKDVLIIRGRNYDPTWIESALDHEPSLREQSVVAVGQVNEADGTEDLMILAETKRGLDQLMEEDRIQLEDRIRKAILSHTGISAKQVVLLNPGDLPRTTSGKLQRKQALNMLLKSKAL
ncbi:AMP-dependent synthetase, partial [bacterium]|nr:AMP-dependent synthetase [bacterium]